MAKILAVDDDEAILATIVDILVADGHAVTPAGNGLQASNLFRKERFDLIVADIVMPEKEGGRGAQMKGRSKRGSPAAKATRNPPAKGPKSRRMSPRKPGARERG